MHEYNITKNNIVPIIDRKFIKVYDLQYEKGKHYFDATRRDLDNLVAIKTEKEFQQMLPDAVSCVVIIDNDGQEPKLLLSYEYRYPTGRFLLGVPAGLIDKKDVTTNEPVLETAKREIFEETGLRIDHAKDRLSVINPLLFSSPGMTDESNALVLAVLRNVDLNSLTQDGAEGQECFDGFALLSKDEARDVLKKGVDDRERFYSVYTWAALVYFCTDMWR